MASAIHATRHLDVRPTMPTEAGVLSDFLGRMFHRGNQHPYLADAHMHWKYWSRRADWDGSRSFAVRHDRTIIAHAAAWPVGVQVPGRIVPAAHVIDWASDSAYPGAGMWLLRQIGARVRMMIATGGSDITRRILPLLGFRPRGELCCFARPVRPLRQALTTPNRTWRLAPRLVRNTWWRLVPPFSVPDGWSASPAAPEDLPDQVWCRPSQSMAVTARDSRLYHFFARSPAVPHVLFRLEKGGALLGYFCIAFPPHVARIADLWVESSSADDWTAAFQTAAAIAADEEDVCEVSAWASTGVARDALFRAGFRLRERCVLSVSGDSDLLAGRELHVQMLDSDASFLNADGGPAYLT